MTKNKKLLVQRAVLTYGMLMFYGLVKGQPMTHEGKYQSLRMENFGQPMVGDEGHLDESETIRTIKGQNF